ncbi:MAG TPA: phosphatidylglycerophosphatase A [Pyrinomonadaceae bacterium]|jgi:phosphatidylglycerophosphatase A
MRTAKESSDELNPPVMTTGAFIAPASGRRTPRDYLALAFATWGVGFLPLAPGTWGSVVGVALYLPLRVATVRVLELLAARYALTYELVESLRVSLMLVAIFCVSGLGIWAASRSEKLLGRKDPGAVVVDEVAGQLITFLFISLSTRLTWWVLVAGFLLFRLFDIWKPYPIRRLEALESGLGIMADDILAGIYAAATLTLLLTSISYVKLIF